MAYSDVKLFGQIGDIAASSRECALAVGNFDGVHRGHAALVAQLVERARTISAPAVVLTFDPHPICLLKPELAQPPLTTIERRAELLGALGVDVVVAYPTDAALLSLPPREFFETIVVGALGARAMVEGPNFFFGKDRAGDVGLLRSMCQEKGISLDVMEAYHDGEKMVSSSRVRSAIEAGEIEAARALLTAPFRISGRVMHGEARGRQLGFPTANLNEIRTLLPQSAVYAANAIVDGANWPAAVNIGARPTFGDARVGVEAHLIGFSGDLYGKTIDLDLVSRLREIRPFGKMEELKEQLQRDVAEAREAVLKSTRRGATAAT